MNIGTVIYGDRDGERSRVSFVQCSNEFLCHKQNPSVGFAYDRGESNE